MVLSLPGGRTFAVIARNLSRENRYVASVTLNGRRMEGVILRHAEILAGGELVFEMTGKPSFGLFGRMECEAEQPCGAPAPGVRPHRNG